MLKLLLFSFLFLFLSCAQAVLNESTKPTQVNVYLEQNLPFSGFNERHNGRGLLVDYWQHWSHQTGITVKFIPYQKEELYPLLNDNQPAVYSALQRHSENLINLNKHPLFGLSTHFYYFSKQNYKITSSLIDKKSPIIVAGLLAEAQQLPFFSSSPNVIYKKYPGLFEIFLALYDQEVDALVLFSFEQTEKSRFNQLLSLLFDHTSLNSSNNELFVYTSQGQEVLLDWVIWGGQIEAMNEKMAPAVEKNGSPFWGTSVDMQANIIITICLFALFSIFTRSKRRKDRQFKHVLDSSPYPLAIFSLDGDSIFYLNDEVKSLFSFKKKKKSYFFEESENQLLLSRFINKASHQITVESEQIRLLVNDCFHDIEISAKRIHYKRQTAWLCYLKDITALLRAEQKLIEERELLRKVLDSIPEQIVFKSPKGSIIGCNEAWAVAHKTTVKHATGRAISDLLSLDMINKQKQQEAIVWTGNTFNTQEWIQKDNSKPSLINIVKLPLHNSKEAVFAVLSIDTDITDLYDLNKQLKDENLQRKETEKALSKQNILLSTVFAISIDPIALLDHQGRVIDANTSFAKLMGVEKNSIIGFLQSEFLSADRAELADAQNNQVLQSGEPIVFEELIFCEGEKVCYEVHKAPFKDPESDSEGIVIMARDITLRKQIEDKLSSDASDFEVKMRHDQLTLIANRRSFDREYQNLWQKACGEQELLSVVMCDIDFFKNYNDNYGHQQGDKALQEIATLLQDTCEKQGCFVARYGGEEFVVVIEGGNATKALKVAEELRQAVEKAQIEHLYSQASNIISLSMGLSSLFPSELNNQKMLLAEANSALYSAKNSGRDQICVH